MIAPETRVTSQLFKFLSLCFLLLFFKGLDPSKTKKETLLLETVKEKGYPMVSGELTAKALMDYSNDPLIFAIKVSEVMPSFYSFIRLNLACC